MVTQPTSDHTADEKAGEKDTAGVDMPAPRVAERRTDGLPGPAMLIAGIVAVVAGIVLLILGIAAAAAAHGGLAGLFIALGVLLVVAGIITLTGLTGVLPGQAR